MREERESAGPTDQQIHAAPQRRLMELADRQHGVVARRQLGALGLSPTMVRDRLRDGGLVRLHRGVYAVGHRRLRREGHALAAVLAAGPGAVLSHRDAAGLHGLRPANHRDTDVTVAAQRRPAPGLRFHRAILVAADVTTVGGVPVTTVARTLVDLAGVVPADHLAAALDEAERIHRVDVGEIERAMARTRGRHGHGHAALRAALAAHRALGVQLTRSELERRFLALVDAHGLPRPRMNAMLHGLEVDAYWPDHGVVVELDGWAFHRTRRAQQRDRDKSNALALHGHPPLRFTHADVLQRPAHVAAQMRAALSGRALSAWR